MLTTEYDLAKPQRNFNRQEVEISRILDLKDDVEELLAKTNLLGEKSMRWVSYIDHSDYDDPCVDNMALTLIKNALLHMDRKMSGSAFITRYQRRVEQYFRREPFKSFQVGFVVVLIAIVIIIFLK